MGDLIYIYVISMAQKDRRIREKVGRKPRREETETRSSLPIIAQLFTRAPAAL